MEVFYGFDTLRSFRNAVVTVGSYDGVHCGHRELLSQIVNRAHSQDGESIVITFSPHPRLVLEGVAPKLLNSLDEKIFLLNQVGVDNLIVAPFTKEFSRTQPQEFVSDYLVDKIGLKSLIVGYDHHFGYGNKGNYALLQELRAQFGFDTVEVSQKLINNGKVSSTVVRHVIEQGDMSQASKLLGFPYFIIGDVNNGILTFDQSHKLLPPDGTYKVCVLDASNDHNISLTHNAEITITQHHPITISPSTQNGRVMVTF